VTIVGDPDQAIFSWRYATDGEWGQKFDIEVFFAENLARFLKDFPSATKIYLDRNYRSTKNILSIAQNVNYLRIYSVTANFATSFNKTPTKNCGQQTRMALLS
jgi:ATP-dependent exoDNAse (exonuclease V) beta subunit